MVSFIGSNPIKELVSAIVRELIYLHCLKQWRIPSHGLPWFFIGEVRINISDVRDTVYNRHKRNFDLFIDKQLPINWREKWMLLDLINV